MCTVYVGQERRARAATFQESWSKEAGGTNCLLFHGTCRVWGEIDG